MRKARNSPKGETSGYRSEALMNFRSILFSVFVAAFSVSAVAQANLNQSHISSSFLPASTLVTNGSESSAAVLSIERQAFQILNDKRTEMGLSVLVWNAEIAELARMHSQNMAGKKFFSHTDLDGNTVDIRAESFGLGDWKAIGENIAYLRGHKEPASAAVANWMKSTGHRQNVLNERYNQSAVGVAVAADGSYYFTQVFMQFEK